ncbi:MULTISPECIES: translation initiation factor IF-2 [Treponema]|uniref:Translation initiation factor IF-2 n=1 Tax=Treponema denticola (strain ATCC 35405 / DSM 14222 / CIP 103919 / JCM 8153 / KCTC 15104) TaxID=243275 RepID=IF2_TREDE|nr:MULTISPECIES: translation initiation factor IF-2 [Treponema]Q73NP6.1 RecName: Full=Translation initiation factor IF-2 [Treponema denticola ATCC 35405]AAS11595.1 translation initiation factor IF-2 [Treponema denticola ATCC 35405]EMB34080.1 translation initiation factor IF-2 [Treponema denticola ATCC 35404]EMB36499.1 translation initiation factor IF-2 [Treponema denticola ATCC 33521]HCY96401.1 translation initiation factor IF-2 [Treponema sp.]
MDIENTNKPDVILNKKSSKAADSKPESGKTDSKRKVVVKVSKTSAGKSKKPESSSEESSGGKASGKQVISVKKASSQSSKPAEASVKEKKPDERLEETKKTAPRFEDKKSDAPSAQNEKRSFDSAKKEEKQTERKKPTPSSIDSIDFASKRPNVKAGNLADSGRRNNRGQGNRPQRPGGQGQGQPGQGRRRESNFSGAQARAYSDGKKQGFRTGQGGQQGRPGDRPQNRPGFGGPRPGAAPAPIPVEKNKAQTNKKAHKAKKEIYNKKNKEEEFFEERLLNQKKKQKEKIHNIPKQIEIMESISVSELAKKMNLKASELIGKLMGMGMMVTMNQSIDADTATILASEYDCDVKIVSLYDETVIESKEDDLSELQPRPPVVTIMGHVDHGKTKTLDAIRSSNVIAGEFGGITQHIGAYTVNTHGGKITFLDTPGHEAFTMMRARGAEITDIVVLVVAADDGVMPQTIEAINHARDAKVPIIVAVNKVDKPEANVDKVKTRLSELGLMPEEWGGDTMFVEISALKKLGLDNLLDTILLQAEVLELKANYTCNAEGKVIESRIDHGRGVVATIIVQRGTLRTGDPYVAGIYSGRVRAIFNDRGEKIDEATPSMPVEILGLEGMPNAGDPFQVTDSERIARQISDKRQELKRFEDSRNVKKVTLDNLYETIHDGEILELKVIIKGDVQGSVEALKQSLEKLSTPEIRLNVIHASAGAINDSDVMLAAADSNALIIGFNVRPTPQAKLLADQEKVDIRKYTVIYKAVEEIQLAMEGMLSPDIKEQVIGMVEVRNTFKVPKIGKIAGCYVLEGVVKRNCAVHVIRDGIVVHSGKLSSLKRFKDDAKEVAAGFECGIGIEDFNDIQVDDQLEIIEMIQVARKLSDSEKYKAPEIKEEGTETDE